MKISSSKIKQIPKEISTEFGLCIYGCVSDEINEWINFHKLEAKEFSSYTNIYIPNDLDLSNLFKENNKFEFMDGFSPNLNKHLHIGHLSNMIMAKCMYAMGINKNNICILGDTLNGEVNKEDAILKYNEYCNKFSYPIHKTFYASHMKTTHHLIDGDGVYSGTKIFNIDGEKIVAIKSDGNTTYFYQDVALADYLNSSTLYLTGYEQCEHFNNLKKMFPHIEHLPIGLVKIDGKKMSSSVGNVIFAESILQKLLQEFNNDYNLSYNVLSGFILKAAPKSDKNIKITDLSNPLNSPGLYLSYTLAKLKSAGVDIQEQSWFNSHNLQYKFLKAKEMLQPNLFFEELISHSKKINALYITHHICDNYENKKLFKKLGDDLLTGMKKIGMMNIDKV